MKNKNLTLVFAFCFVSFYLFSQNLYTARGYWEESTKPSYKEIKSKEIAEDSLSNDEKSYLRDYEIYLNSYYQKLSQEEKVKFADMKSRWDAELNEKKLATSRPEEEKDEFEWRNRDKFTNTLYGLYYGSSLAIVAEIQSAATAGIPLITGGAWLLGPALNKKKYEGITQTTIRASNTGKLLGLIYGGSLGLVFEGDEGEGKLPFFLSTVGSIGLGEIAFQSQKRNNTSEGRVEMMRHYGFLGPSVAIASNIAIDNDASTRIVGASLLAGGVVGLVIGNKVGQRYEYSRGDVDAISSLTLLTTGLGFTPIAEKFYHANASALIMIPAISAIAGTFLGQRAVNGVHLSRKQGSMINLVTGGAVLIGVGILTIAEVESPTAWIGVPSALGLLAHQITFSSFKKENLLKGSSGLRRQKHNFRFSMNVTPENYFINERMPKQGMRNPNRIGSNPIVKLKVTL